MKNILVVLLSIIVLTGCTEPKEKISNPKILLGAVENKLPASSLADPDMVLQENILSTAPEVKSFKKLTASINKQDPHFGFKATQVTWMKNKTVITTSIVGGEIWYDTFYKCTQRGFWSCQSGYTVDYRMKLKSNINNKEYYIYEISQYPKKYRKEYTEKNKAGVDITKRKTLTRGGVDLPQKHNSSWLSTNYPLVFKNIPYNALRSFNLYEDNCSSKSRYKICGIKIKYFDQELDDQKDILTFLSERKIASISIKGIDELYNKYLKYDAVTEFLAEKILFRIKQENSIETLHKFNNRYGAQKNIVLKSIDKLYELIKIKDSVAGYEWFISNYSDSKYAKLSLERIHEIMFKKAEKVDTITAYNSFIFSYPTAKQVTEANEIAGEKERVIYTSLGIMSFWDSDHKKEKKARKLLIKAKQIERFPRDNKLYGNRKSGYLIVANRMYKLLQEDFDDTDATLRYLESQEFKDFVIDFKKVMSEIQSTLDSINKNSRNISRYTKEMIQVSKDGFSDAQTDRAMAAYYDQEHRNWEKQMHYKDKGYN